MDDKTGVKAYHVVLAGYENENLKVLIDLVMIEISPEHSHHCIYRKRLPTGWEKELPPRRRIARSHKLSFPNHVSALRKESCESHTEPSGEITNRQGYGIYSRVFI